MKAKKQGRGCAIDWEKKLENHPGKSHKDKINRLFKRHTYMYRVRDVLGIADSVTLRRKMKKLGIKTQEQIRYDWMLLLKDYEGDIPERLHSLNRSYPEPTQAAKSIGITWEALRGKYHRAGVRYAARNYTRRHKAEYTPRKRDCTCNPLAETRAIFAEIRRRLGLPDDYMFDDPEGQEILQRYQTIAERVQRENLVSGDREVSVWRYFT